MIMGGTRGFNREMINIIIEEVENEEKEGKSTLI